MAGCPLGRMLQEVGASDRAGWWPDRRTVVRSTHGLSRTVVPSQPGSGARRRSRLPASAAILLLCITTDASDASRTTDRRRQVPRPDRVLDRGRVASATGRVGYRRARRRRRHRGLRRAALASVAAGPPPPSRRSQDHLTASDGAYERLTGRLRRATTPRGCVKDRTLLPALGNHEFKTPGGAGYFAYFGARAGTPGEGWYSTDIGGWHIVVLNSNCTIVGCGPGSPQLTWLKADLAAHPAMCTLAIWHHPRFSSGFHRNALAVAPFWAALSAAHADLIINGHDHDYERFAPQSPAGTLDTADGIREIVVGTGGAQLRPFTETEPNREAASDDTHGSSS